MQDEANQVVTLHAWMTQTWRDEFLSWSPQEYGISSVTVPVHRVWIPDTCLYNKLDTHYPTISSVLAMYCYPDKRAFN